MSTTKDFIEYVAEQAQGVGNIRYRKMFGEYMVYVDDRPALLVCDNTVYVKILPELEGLMEGAEKGYPYTGAKEHYILDIDDRMKCFEVFEILKTLIPLPKKK